MPVGRDAAAKAEYLASDRKERKAMILFSLCDEGAAVGLARDYNAQDMRWLARTRKTPCHTRAERLKRRSNFYMVLSRIAARDERSNVWAKL